MHHAPPLAETFEQILHEQEPNFLRLYLNPHVAQTCFCLDRYMNTTWTEPPASLGHRSSPAEDYQSFLANGLEEALGGAIKLARYNQPTTGQRARGLILDPADRLTCFTGTQISSGDRVVFLPGLDVYGEHALRRDAGALDLGNGSLDGNTAFNASGLDLLVLVAGNDPLFARHAETIRRIVRRHTPRVITCVDRASLKAIRSGSGGIFQEIAPDIVVFDDSFVDKAVPFSAFTARKSLFAPWNRPGKSTFHSTTFQPNTISTRHFMKCLASQDPEFHGRHNERLGELITDMSKLSDCFGRHFNPSLLRLIRMTGFQTRDVRAVGSFIVVDGRLVFDAVSGVASSFRGHNPDTYADEIEAMPSSTLWADRDGPAQAVNAHLVDHADLRRRLFDLTGLAHFLPAVSGATSVENALKIALVAQFPRRHILALKSGFGGKTLLALSGTANPVYKERIDPLYPDIHYVDPFAPDVLAQIDALMQTYQFAVVEMELIQAVGGVRPIPEHVIRHLDAGRARWGYLLLVDEVQTGMYRTGPFVVSRTRDLAPDILLLGKATSDTMFPFALTLYSATVHDRLNERGSELTDLIVKQYGYEQGYKTVVNVLRLAEVSDIQCRVAESGALFAKLLNRGLASSKIVRAVRVFGLLIAIELDITGWPQRWLRRHLSSFYLLAILRHADFPVFAGFTQYEPNVIKVTPPLNVSPDEVRQACATIVDVLSWPLLKVLVTVLRGLINRSPIARKKHEYSNVKALEPAAR